MENGQKGENMFDFLSDLDGYFCETYANYDRICGLPGYKMPKMQDSRVGADGRTYAYTLPSNTLRLALQENKDEILKEFKKRAYDKTFSFAFLPLGLFGRLKKKLSKDSFYKIFQTLLKKYDFTNEDAEEKLTIEKHIWSGICKGKYLPTKNFVFSVALAAQMNAEDMKNALLFAGYELDFTEVKDVVVAYLLMQKVYNPVMVEAALKEYKVDNLFLKKLAE